MSNDELKKKIVKILEEGYTPIEYDDWDCGRTYFPTNEDVADALIVAGIGDVAKLTDKWRGMLESQAKKTEEAEHRAEVAERALENACEDIISTTDFLCKLEKTGGVVTVKNYSPDNANAEAYLKRAEKELAEE